MDENKVLICRKNICKIIEKDFGNYLKNKFININQYYINNDTLHKKIKLK